MTVAEKDSEGRLHVLRVESEITRLGKGVDRTGRLDAAAMDRTLAAISRFHNIVVGMGVEKLAAAGTSALRDADNGAEFCTRIQAETGIDVRVISGDQEAQYAYWAARSDTDLAIQQSADLLVFDIGGGSTELTFGDSHGIRRHSSLDIGAVRLTERCMHSDPPLQEEIEHAKEIASKALATFDLSAGIRPRIVGIGGTAVNIAGMSRPDATVHGAIITKDTVVGLLVRMASMTLGERRRLEGLEPERADVIVAGAIVLDRLLDSFHADEFVVSVRGLRFGLIAEMASDAA